MKRDFERTGGAESQLGKVFLKLGVDAVFPSLYRGGKPAIEVFLLLAAAEILQLPFFMSQGRMEERYPHLYHAKCQVIRLS